jgi:hypothetical protein
MMDRPAIERAIADVHRDRRWIIVTEPAVAATDQVAVLRANGARAVMVVAAVEGVGELPDADRIHYTRSSGTTTMAGIRAFVDSIEQPSASLLAAVDAFDPDHEAMVLGQNFSRATNLAGRPVYGYRKRSWRDLEDKMVVDELWDAAGVTRSPSAIVPPAEAAPIARSLASPLGTVWVGDNRGGWHGGGEYVRWVRSATDVAEASAWFTDRADRVRVMPFLDGLPCSIHGFVTGDGVAVFLPVELLILRRADRPGFVYARGANYWTPPDRLTEQMRSAARSVGELLRDRLGYRGAFGVDGIATTDGFRPTELNPRLSLGHFLQARAAEFPLVDAEPLVLAGDLDLVAAELESEVVAASRIHRGGGMMFLVPGSHDPEEVGFRFVGDDVEPIPVSDGGGAEPDVDGRLHLGAASSGSVVIARLDPDRIPVGPSLAPRAPGLVRLARDLWDVDIPEVLPAPDVFVGGAG